MTSIKNTKEWETLFNELEALQNKIEHIDILTITGFMTTLEELQNHIERCSSRTFYAR